MRTTTALILSATILTLSSMTSAGRALATEVESPYSAVLIGAVSAKGFIQGSIKAENAELLIRKNGKPIKVIQVDLVGSSLGANIGISETSRLSLTFHGVTDNTRLSELLGHYSGSTGAFATILPGEIATYSRAIHVHNTRFSNIRIDFKAPYMGVGMQADESKVKLDLLAHPGEKLDESKTLGEIVASNEIQPLLDRERAEVTCFLKDQVGNITEKQMRILINDEDTLGSCETETFRTCEFSATGLLKPKTSGDWFVLSTLNEDKSEPAYVFDLTSETEDRLAAKQNPSCTHSTRIQALDQRTNIRMECSICSAHGLRSATASE